MRRVAKRPFGRKLFVEILEAREVLTFTPLTPLSVGSSPQAVAAADFNNDGNLDFATANAGDNTVSIRLSNGSGGFTDAAAVTTGDGPTFVAVGDFNRDGVPDLAITNEDSTVVNIRLGNGSGGFTNAANVTVGSYGTSVAVGDFNRDGKLDFASTNQSDDTVSIRLGDGTGGFTNATDVSTGITPKFVAVGDFNRDGIPDLAVANSSSATINIRLGNGSGGFTDAADLVIGFFCKSMVVGDFNRDGISDLAAAVGNDSNVQVRLGVGDGTFTSAANVSAGFNPQSVTLGDFDGDGKLDLATANLSGNTVSIRLGDGAGNFTGTTELSISNGPVGLTAGDFNGDGKPDLLVTNKNGGTATVLRNDYVFASPSSYNLDQTINVGDGPNYIATGDFNRDGHLDFAVANFDGTSNKVSIRLSDGLGGFTSASDVTVGDKPANVVAADVNRDGILDLVVANFNSSTVSIRLGDGLGGFEGTTNLPVNTGPYFVAVADFNNDGKLDVVSLSNSLNTVQLFLANGTGGFSEPNDFTVGSGPGSIAVGDFNNDGNLDMAFTSFSDQAVDIRLGNGTGTFTAVADVTFTTNAPVYVNVGDFNGDGILDLVTANINTSTVSLRLGDGLGGFSGTADFTVGSAPYSVVVGDFNRDGHLDVATSNGDGDSISILFGDGQGTFSTPTDVSVGDNPRFVTVGDFDRDGVLDFIAANRNDDTVSIALGLTSTTVNVSAASTFFSTAARTVSLSATAVGQTTGSVTFTLKQGSTVIGSPTSGNVDSNGVATVSYALPAGQAAGSYTIEAEFTGGSLPGSGTGTLTLSNATTTTSMTTSGTTTYGDNLTFNATVGVTNGSVDLTGETVQFFNNTTLLGSGTLSAVGGGVYQASFTLVGGLAAGTYTQLNAAFVAPANVDDSTSGDVSHTVNTKALTVTADNRTKVYGNALATLTVSVSGLVLGETAASVLTGSPTTSVTFNTPVGTYDITQGTLALASNNYTLTFVQGTATVTPAPLIVTGNSFSRYAGKANPTLTGTITGFKLGETESVVSGLTYGTTAMLGSLPGSYPVTGSGGMATNYAFTYVPGALVVYTAPLAAVGTTEGGTQVVNYYNADGQMFTLTPYNATFRGGIRVATGDVTGDGYADVIVAPGPSDVVRNARVYDGKTGALLASFFLGNATVATGTNIAAADVLKTGKAQILVGTEAGTSPFLYVYGYGNGTVSLLRNFAPFPASFQGGVAVAGARGVLVAGMASKGGAVKVYSGPGLGTVQSFNPFGSSFNVGVSVAVSDGGQIAVGRRTGFADVKVFDLATLAQVATFLTQDTGAATGFAGGTRLAWQRGADGAFSLLVGTGPGWPAEVQTYAASTWTRTSRRTEFGGTRDGLWLG